MRYPKFKWVSFLFFFALFMNISALIASASDNNTEKPVNPAIGVEVVGKNVNVRDAPSMKGRILDQLSPTEYFVWNFIADAAPMLDRSDNSEWYKLLFGMSEYNGEFYRLDESFFTATPYISAKYIKEVPLTGSEQQQIDYFRQGRPLRYHTGDLVDGLNISPNTDVILPINKPVSLHSAPDETAIQKVFPKSTKIIVYPVGRGGDIYNWGNVTLYWYLDLNDVAWVPVIGENQRIKGWLHRKEFYDGTLSYDYIY